MADKKSIGRHLKERTLEYDLRKLLKVSLKGMAIIVNAIFEVQLRLKGNIISSESVCIYKEAKSMVI